MTPAVSVLITAYNAASVLPRALTSLAQQTLADFEILVVDDGSTDDTPALLAGWADARLRVLSPGRLGRGGALAHGLTAARSRYVAILDADDEAMPERLARQAAFLDTHPDHAWVGGGEEIHDSRRDEAFARSYPTTDAAIRRQAARCIPYSHSAVMLRRGVCDHGLTYDADRRYLIDFALFLDIARHFRVANLPDVMVRRHVRGDSYFQARFTATRQNLALARLCARAVGELQLPRWHYIFPLARLAYPYVPVALKARLRRRTGLQEQAM